MLLHSVEDTESKQVVGKEVVYTPLEVDPNLSPISNFNNIPHDAWTKAYASMTAHAIYLLRCRGTTDLFQYFCDQKILNLSIDVLREKGRKVSLKRNYRNWLKRSSPMTTCSLLASPSPASLLASIS